MSDEVFLFGTGRVGVFRFQSDFVSVRSAYLSHIRGVEVLTKYRFAFRFRSLRPTQEPLYPTLRVRQMGLQTLPWWVVEDDRREGIWFMPTLGALVLQRGLLTPTLPTVAQVGT